MFSITAYGKAQINNRTSISSFICVYQNGETVHSVLVNMKTNYVSDYFVPRNQFVTHTFLVEI